MDAAIDSGSTGRIEGSGFYFRYSRGNNAKKNELKPWLVEEWCIPKAGAEFVAAMEDVLEVYQRPYNPEYPVVCLDEANRQLIEEVRPSLPTNPGECKKVDYEYRRKGVVDFFMMFEPLAGQRQVEVRDSRTRKDFAYCIKKLADDYYPNCKKIVLVMDNLNTHSVASLYDAFPPEEALRLANRLEIHYTPKHGSWLDMAEIEIGVMSRQCLKGYLSDKESVTAQVKAWSHERNSRNVSVNWQFTTADARIKLKSLYPIIT